MARSSVIDMTALRALTEAAARPRLAESGAAMRKAAETSDPTVDARAMWALGDYHRFARALVWDVGPVLVEACDVTAGDHLLDVAAGTGNVAIRAAERGARVVASDLTPENFAMGRREGAERGVELEWIEADAEALPFADGAFDVVTSCFGVMFAPDHRAAARELVRVCRPGGRIGIASFTPGGTEGAFFELVARHAPPPPAGALSPVLWGDEDHIRALLGDRVDTLKMERRTYVERAESPAAYRRLFEETFGPVVALRSALSADTERLAAFDRDFAEFSERENRRADAAEYAYQYLLVVARTPS
jgi:ubiquinone/menaquinone biosynthesis C-methylase UbiE